MTRTVGDLSGIVGPVSRETESRLNQYAERLVRWTKTSNLVAPSTIDDLWSRHILDSAQLVALKPDATRWVDLGSGGGLPGIVIAILLAENGETVVHLVESNAKKAAFLHSTIAELKIPARVHRRRIEDAWDHVGAVDVVTARALAPLNTLLGLARPWLERGATGLFPKGRDFVGELAKSRDDWGFDLIEHPSVIDPESRILEIGGLRSR
mgnify:FL=1